VLAALDLAVFGKPRRIGGDLGSSASFIVLRSGFNGSTNVGELTPGDDGDLARFDDGSAIVAIVSSLSRRDMRFARLGFPDPLPTGDLDFLVSVAGRATDESGVYLDKSLGFFFFSVGVLIEVSRPSGAFAGPSSSADNDGEIFLRAELSVSFF
jgi:hypothetical protein